MTSVHLERSFYIVNTFSSYEVKTGKLYVKIATLFVKQENIENDIVMPLSIKTVEKCNNFIENLAIF